MKSIVIRGAAEQNLKDVSLEIPHHAMTVFSGVSGSGKSSLAHETICREGQRRFLESLSAYARQYLGTLDRPRVESIEGLAPTVSIDQKTVGRSPRSTVGTITEIYDHLRLLFARLGAPHCPRCGDPIRPRSAASIADQVLADFDGKPLLLCAPIVRGRKGEYRKRFPILAAEGHVRLRVDGALIRLDRGDPPVLDRYKRHTIEIVMDRIEARREARSRLTESIEKCTEVADGVVDVVADGKEHLYSSRFACARCGKSLPEVEPRLFSFNSPHGACTECQGVGSRWTIDDDLHRTEILETCPACGGARLCPEARAVRFQGRSITELCAMAAGKLHEHLSEVSLSPSEAPIGEPILRELNSRLGFLRDVGLDYLSLDRGAATLAGGEAQRLRLAGQVGAGLQGVLFVLDEPSIGLHPRDNRRLLATLHRLRDAGNTVLVVEHDRETIESADFIVDLGPGAGKEGGEIVVSGSLDDVRGSARSLTGQYLSGARRVQPPERRRAPGEKWLELIGASHHNLRNVDVRIPLGLLVVLSGVSGSGKSSLVHGVLRPELSARIGRGKKRPGRLAELHGAEWLDQVVEIDQSPIGRSPRSNPATYIKLFGLVRDFFASLPEARLRGYGPERFSFNRHGGRCLTCGGAGVIEIEMQFLPPVEMLCDECGGKRYNRETLEVTSHGRTIADVLAMTVRQALDFFQDHPRIRRMLDTMHCVGLDYIPLGHPSPLLSGGEAQRVKLAAELHRPDTGRTLYLLDEPTTGLHFEDVCVLLETLQALVDRGNTVLVIEHNTELMRTADWIIDLGPEAGEKGGEVVACGPPEEVARAGRSHTGRILAGGIALDGPREPLESRREAVHRPAESRDLVIRGATQHNLKGVTVRIPRDKLTVITGVSGSGKSSLAFDTIFTEGQRRYVEALSTYARRFLGRLENAPVESIEGLSPAIAIDQKSAPRNPRSTLATITEIHDHLRLLFARIGKPYCPHCDLPLEWTTPSRLAAELAKNHPEARGFILSHLAPGILKSPEPLAALIKEGYTRLLADEREVRLDGAERLPEAARDVYLVLDRVVFCEAARSRIAAAIEQAFQRGAGRAVVQVLGEPPAHYSREPACSRCDFQLESELTPRMFSFNSLIGACPRCHGLGVEARVAPSLLIGDPERPLLDGALHPKVHHWLRSSAGALTAETLRAMAVERAIPIDGPFGAIDDLSRGAVLQGTGDAVYSIARPHSVAGGRAARGGSGVPPIRRAWKGLIAEIEEWHRAVRDRMKPGFFDGVMRQRACSLCEGGRLRQESLRVRIGRGTEDNGLEGKGRGIFDVSRLTVTAALEYFAGLRLDAREATIAAAVLTEIRGRLRFLSEVGLDYLTLDRSASTLSGGEAQRIRLASQIGNRLVGVLYVLDEPTVGLHPRDTVRLLAALRNLRDLGNTVIVVEHDRETIERADYVIDLGPGAGPKGGEVLASGPPEAIRASRESLTGRYLRGELRVAPPREPRRASPGSDGRVAAVRLRGVRHHNLKDIDAEFPLGLFTAVTGVSGSGKSSLVIDVLARTLAEAIESREGAARDGKARAAASGAGRGPRRRRRRVEEVEGADSVRRLVLVDQSALGKSPRSNPATYTGLWEEVRGLLALTPQARMRGYGPERFSFNRPGGRCEACTGEGAIRVEMHFLSDVWVACEECGGQRFNRQTLEIRYKGLQAGEILSLEVDRAREIFADHPRPRAILDVLHEVGLGYLRLGQSATTLSGGEAQRVKLAAELAARTQGGTFYILDEPTTGLHFDDVRKLLEVFQRLVSAGNTLVVIEHNLDVIRSADWVIDLGPEGGEAGGRIVAAGPPEVIARVPESHTGRYLAARG